MEFELLTKGTGDRILVPYFEKTYKGTPWIPDDNLKDFKGKVQETFSVLIPAKSCQIHLLGLGSEKNISSSQEVFRNFVIKKGDLIQPSLLVDLRHLPPVMIYHSVLGLALSSYSIGMYKTSPEDQPKLEKVQLLVSHSDKGALEMVKEAQYTASTTQRISQLVDAPGNIKTPRFLAHWARQSGQEYGYHVEILPWEALEKEGLHALLAVGQGSDHNPLLIKMEYRPRKSEGYQLGLVGKGVTFDSGGLSIKRAANMHYMKSDMAGAAAVMGAIELAARLQLPLNMVAVIPVAENTVDARSIKPGDVISSYSGKSIEIIDTDAEGRLILADALSYIQKNYEPHTIIDLATLTGSCVATLGYHAGGLFSNNEELALDLSKAGQDVHERLWRLPLWDDYEDDMNSDVADIKNLSGSPVAGAITAAKFLEFFIKDHPRWAHLDIAGVAFGTTQHAKMKSATGYGVRLLLAFAKSMLSSSK